MGYFYFKRENEYEYNRLTNVAALNNFKISTLVKQIFKFILLLFQFLIINLREYINMITNYNKIE